MSKVLVIYAVAALAGTFRRAGTAFTTEGTAFPEGHFSPKQLSAINKEKRLSVREVDADKVPEGVDTSLLAASAAGKADEKGQAKKGEGNAPAAETLEQAFAMLDPSNKEHFTAANLPQLDALSKLLARPVKAADRDAAWQAFVVAQAGNQ